MKDLFAPTVAKARLLDDGDRSGKLTVGFDAADLGGGLYRTVVKVDGKVARATAMGGPPCADALTSDADPYQFDVPVPCPRMLTGARAEVDVRTLSPGAHGVELAIEDAAGNETAVYGPTEFPRANGTNASTKATLRMWFAKGLRRLGTKTTSRLGRRVVTRGILRNERGVGIQGARIDVYHVRKGKRRLLKTGLKTRARGAAHADPAQRRRHALDPVRLPRGAARPDHEPLDAAPERRQAQREALPPPLSPAAVA